MDGGFFVGLCGALLGRASLWFGRLVNGYCLVLLFGLYYGLEEI